MILFSLIKGVAMYRNVVIESNVWGDEIEREQIFGSCYKEFTIAYTLALVGL